MINRSLLAITSAVVTAGLPSRGHAQAPAAADSQKILHVMHAAQVRFERVRRQHMRWGSPNYGTCEIRIGRYCLTNLDWGDDETWTEPEEDPKVELARYTLIARLDSAARLIPGDAWIAGQRVRYLVEARDPASALAAATACQAARAWCLALTGFAHYWADDFLRSELAYSDALAHMSESQRCEWSDLGDVLSGALRKRYRDLPCTNRDSLQRRIMWLADPFYSVPGNELRAEHFSRHVHSALLRDAEAPEGDRWGRDLHEFVLRYGWTFGWERVQTSSVRTLDPEVRGYFGHGAKYFLPDAQLVDDATGTDLGHGTLEPSRPRAGHVPRYAVSAFLPLTHHLAAFVRDDSLIIVASFELNDDSIPRDASVEASMFLQRNERAPPIAADTVVPGTSGSLVAKVPATPHVLSLEVLAEEQRRAARARYGIGPSRLITTADRYGDGATVETDSASLGSRRALSGLLLAEVGDSLPESLDAAIVSLRQTNRARPGERLGLYWELYGTGPAAERVSTSLTLAKRGKSLVRRVAGVFGIGSDKPPVSLQWRDVTSPRQAYFPRAVAVDLPQNLGAGTYVLMLTVDFDNGETIRLERTLKVESRD